MSEEGIELIPPALLIMMLLVALTRGRAADIDRIASDIRVGQRIDGRIRAISTVRAQTR